ncbi:glycosyl hydrolase family 88 protein [Aspergillus japonicus CBS 114.51]|uniref:Glycosyl hydrolase family 88 protein n=1 Tax=Aspergillus japonicus CBS 114.51 TaxID=1448312 RepID=A0A8T8WUX8_ASPJA|nr:glycosyl hydrolase family 88 protein [Aspergillus japonicus CBS 114.51]RAH79149.1 glycosyl hydrolase family 88 protein [Aspergillus japonicus CBS 114.51]
MSSTLPKSLTHILFSESVAAKLWYVASKALGKAEPPTFYPEYTGRDGGRYVYRDLSFWTSGFFPGSLYLLLERQTMYDHRRIRERTTGPHPLQLEHLCQWWTINLHQNALLSTTHDLGFMIAPWAIKAWELQHDARAFSTLVVAAHTLARRFCPRVQAIRSWDTCITKRYAFKDPSKDFLVIIDNMLNLDMLFWVAKATNDRRLFDIAVAHARTTQQYHIRPDNSSYHVVNFDDTTAQPKQKLTNQGFSDESCWSRGQAWGILGFAQTFLWTQDRSFLATAQALADYFIEHLPPDGVPYWDFDAPVTGKTPRDTSAAMIASCGMLLLYKACRTQGLEEVAGRYLRAAERIVQGTLASCLNPPTFRFAVSSSEDQFETYEDGAPSEHQPKQEFGSLVVDDGTEGGKAHHPPKETILNGATINNYEFAPRRWANHGLVYADYYFMLLGNMLLELGLVEPGF